MITFIISNPEMYPPCVFCIVIPNESEESLLPFKHKTTKAISPHSIRRNDYCIDT